MLCGLQSQWNAKFSGGGSKLPSWNKDIAGNSKPHCIYSPTQLGDTVLDVGPHSFGGSRCTVLILTVDLRIHCVFAFSLSWSLQIVMPTPKLHVLLTDLMLSNLLPDLYSLHWLMLLPLDEYPVSGAPSALPLSYCNSSLFFPCFHGSFPTGFSAFSFSFANPHFNIKCNQSIL